MKQPKSPSRPEPAALVEDAPELLTVKDVGLGDLFSPEFLEKFEVHSYRNAARIIAAAGADEFREVIDALTSFSIRTDEVVKPGGSKTDIAKRLEELMAARGWFECRISGDLHVRKTSKEIEKVKSRTRKTPVQRLYRIVGFIDGHKIDFVKNRLAFDMEWNSKDQTFDRDLYAARTFYECGIIDAGILLTRSKALAPMFADIGSRVHIKDFKAKYGASTTWMGKLLYRLDAGRSGGCPILAIGIKPAVIEDFEAWKISHPVLLHRISSTELIEDTDEAPDD